MVQPEAKNHCDIHHRSRVYGPIRGREGRTMAAVPCRGAERQLRRRQRRRRHVFICSPRLANVTSNNFNSNSRKSSS